MTTQEDVTEESASESESIIEGDADDEDGGEESLQTLQLALQELEEAPVSVSAETEPTTRETKYRAREEIKLTRDTSAKDTHKQPGHSYHPHPRRGGEDHQVKGRDKSPC